MYLRQLGLGLVVTHINIILTFNCTEWYDLIYHHPHHLTSYYHHHELNFALTLGQLESKILE